MDTQSLQVVSDFWKHKCNDALIVRPSIARELFIVMVLATDIPALDDEHSHLETGVEHNGGRICHALVLAV